MKNTRLRTIILFAACLLAVPLIAMQFTSEVKWTILDFFASGVLLFGTGLLCELVLRKVTRLTYRVAICGAILFALFIIWAELAVGLIGTPLAGS